VGEFKKKNTGSLGRLNKKGRAGKGGGEKVLDFVKMKCGIAQKKKKGFLTVGLTFAC